MEKITLKSSLARNITFTGELLFSNRYETGTGTHTKMAVYKTSGGNYACEKVYETQWQGSSDNYLAIICKTHDEIIKFFGLGNQAKCLYSRLDISYEITEDEFLKNGNPKQEWQDLNEFDEAY